MQVNDETLSREDVICVVKINYMGCIFFRHAADVHRLGTERDYNTKEEPGSDIDTN